MRRLLFAAGLLPVTAVLASCGPLNAMATKIDDRTYRVEGPGVPGGAVAPNRRTAERVCPGGYRVLDSTRHKEGAGGDASDASVSTTWVIRCL